MSNAYIKLLRFSVFILLILSFVAIFYDYHLIMLLIFLTWGCICAVKIEYIRQSKNPFTIAHETFGTFMAFCFLLTYGYMFLVPGSLRRDLILILIPLPLLIAMLFESALYVMLIRNVIAYERYKSVIHDIRKFIQSSKKLIIQMKRRKNGNNIE